MTSAAERIATLYERYARQWDRDRGRSLFEQAWLDRFLALIPARAPVLDLGCGSGEPISRYLIEQGCEITGVDTSRTLIGLCSARFRGQCWIVADMRGLCLNRDFTGILAWDSFFHLDRRGQRAMFPVFREHAAPGAALMFTSGPRDGEAIGSYQGEPLYHASLDPEEYRALLDQHGFDVVDCVVEDRSCGGHTIWLAQRR